MRYVLIFQIREALLHRLRDEQRLLVKDFMGYFVKPELLLVGRICEFGVHFRKEA